MIATSGFLTTLECIIFVFGRGSDLDPTRGAYSALPNPLSGLKGPASMGRQAGRERERTKVRKGTGGTAPPPFANSWIRPCTE